MVIVYLFASLLGMLTTIAVLSSYGWLIAFFCAPLGGSALTVAVGFYVGRANTASLRPAVVCVPHLGQPPHR
jgi:hypothetical protein